ncbi:hypothetical protein BX600DRAFT_460968 [Xylariales sp. PMI_506]|nr:hypothetical protein BX600DRAFT_460968 [Xylariales sp. PMI_506]
MPLELQDVEFSDGEALSFVYISSFFDDAFNKTQFPGVSFDRLLAGAVSRWPRNYGDLSRIYKKVVDTETGQIVSYSLWEFANTTARGELRKPIGLPEGFIAGPPVTPDGLDDPFATEFSNKVREIRERILGERPAMTLRMMGTLPSYRRRGAASLHLAWATELADREGIACWTEGSPMALALYHKFGFVDQGEVVSQLAESAGGGTYTYTSILREPSRPARTARE